MAGIPLNTSQAKRQKLLDILPEYDWSIVKAGLAAGYSEHYAKTRLKGILTKDVKFCKALLARRAQIEAQTQDQREKGLQVLHEIRDNPKATDRDRVAAVLAEGKMCGWLSETRVLESKDRQQQLDESQRELAAKAATAVYDTRRLPDGSYLPEPPKGSQNGPQGPKGSNDANV